MMQPDTDPLFSFTFRASSSARAQRILTVLIPVPAPLARRKQTKGGNSVTVAHTRRMVSEELEKPRQPVVARAHKNLSMCYVWKEPKQGSIDGKCANCAGPEIFGQVIESTDHFESNPVRLIEHLS